jgi:bifunctional UDP-N-acetylglucosamine pyrophosphorylase/glucosamine-1-phosphate N-acetyltransferase
MTEGNKHRSVVKDGAFVGCNVNLVSPVVVEERAYIAAETTVTRNVPKEALCVGRAKDKNIEGWVVRREFTEKRITGVSLVIAWVIKVTGRV